MKDKIANFFKTEYHKWVNYVRRYIDTVAERDGEDIVQDVILNLFSKADPGTPIENLSAYIYRSLRNRAIDLVRKKDKDNSLRKILDEMSGFEAPEDYSDAHYQSVFNAMEALPADDRKVIIATEMEGRTFRELAGDWGVPIGTLLARKSRAIEKIRSMVYTLEHQEGDKL